MKGLLILFFMMEREGIKFALSQLAIAINTGPFIVMVLILKLFLTV